MSEVSDPIFARIAARYDRINRILSLGQERAWRGRGIDDAGAWDGAGSRVWDR